MQAQKFKTGDIAYFVESNRFIRKGRVETCGGGLVLYHFIEGGAIRVKEHRLYHSEEEAVAYLDQLRKQKPTPTLTPAFWNH